MAIALGSLLKYGKDRSNLKLKEINLDDNGLKDESFAHILDAISNQTDLQVINYNNNGLGLKSVAVLACLLQRKPPDNLKEFRISNVKSSRQAMQKLLELLETASSLRKLRLSYLDIKSDLMLLP